MTWQTGDVILWCYRREVLPATVVQDRDGWLVVWIAPGTSLLTAVPADGRGLRDRPVEERFVCPRVFGTTQWYGAGVLRLAREGDAHSSWLFRRPDDHAAVWGWYGNLEDPIRRSAAGVHTTDHVLDVWLDLTTGVVGWKDEDELEAAIAVNKFTPEDAAAIRAHGEVVFNLMERREPPYDGSWLDWTPDPGWPVPPLPDEFAALEGLAAYELFPDQT